MADGAITRACTAQQPWKGICGAVVGSCAHDAPSPPPGGLVCHGAGRKERTGLGSVPAANPCLSARQICELLVPSVPIRPIPSPISHPTPPPVPLRPSCRLPCVVLSALAPLFLPPGSPRFFGINRSELGRGRTCPISCSGLPVSCTGVRSACRLARGLAIRQLRSQLHIRSPWSVSVRDVHPLPHTHMRMISPHHLSGGVPAPPCGFCQAGAVVLCPQHTPQRRSRPPTSASHLRAWA